MKQSRLPLHVLGMLEERRARCSARSACPSPSASERRADVRGAPRIVRLRAVLLPARFSREKAGYSIAIRSSPRSRSIPRRSIRTSGRSASSRPSSAAADKLRRKSISGSRKYAITTTMKSCFHQPVHRRPVQATQCPYREKSGKRGSLPRLYAADYPLSDAQETADALKDLALRLCACPRNRERSGMRRWWILSRCTYASIMQGRICRLSRWRAR